MVIKNLFVFNFLVWTKQGQDSLGSLLLNSNLILMDYISESLRETLSCNLWL